MPKGRVGLRESDMDDVFSNLVPQIDNAIAEDININAQQIFKLQSDSPHIH